MALKYQRMRKPQLPNGELNITSLMDILTTLIFFIILLAGFNHYFDLPANPLEMGQASTVQKKPTFTLEVTLKKSTHITVWLGPVEGLNITNEPHLRHFLHGNFKGNEQIGYSHSIHASNAKAALKRMQSLLIQLKQSFPNEFKVVLSVGGGISWQNMIDAVSTVRSYSAASASPRTMASTSNKDFALFPEVIISEWNKGS